MLKRGGGGTGRPKGSKNRLNWAFVTALAEDFEQHGIETIRICRVEKPNEYLKIVAGLMPREFTFEDNRLQDLSDDELDAILEFARQRLAATAKRELISYAGSREEPALNGEQARLLQALPKAS
jgi:hypothetical protein